MSDARDLPLWLVAEWRDALRRTGLEVELW